MDTAAASAGTGGASLGFAIPANTIDVIAGQITTHRQLPGLIFGRRPFLGVEIVNSAQGAGAASPFGAFGSPFGPGPAGNTPTGTHGALVAAVDPGSPAARARITSGDVITAVDGHPTPTTAALSRQISVHKPGQTVSLTVSTHGGTRTVQVTLAQGPIS